VRKSIVLIALIIGALLLSALMPALGAGTPAEAAPADSTQAFEALCLKGLKGPVTSHPMPPLPKGPPEDTSADKWAVVIGIADYEGTEYDLYHPDEDAWEMTRVLVRDYGFPRENIIQLYNEEATFAAIVAAIQWLKVNEGPNSTVVFFYSGHGFQVPDWYLLDGDIESDGFDEGIGSYDLYPIPDGYLAALFQGFESQKFTLIFNSCNSGGMFDDDDDLQAEGRVIVAACAADQLAWDSRRLDNTLFGYYFVDRGIRRGLAEGLHISGDGVSMEEALEYAYPLVTAVHPDSQPQIYDGFEGELVP
jgi:hypothetical protein